MDSPYPHLFTPIQVGHVTLPNRFMMGSMHTELEHRPEGLERLAAFYAERAKGGVALMATGGFSPNDAGNLTDQRGQMSTEADVKAHEIIPRAVHDYGGRIVLQILHSGRYGYHPNIVAPSAIRSPINRDEPRELSETEIEQTIVDFVNCAALAQQAGYDGAEIMGSEGYLITEFLSTRTNKRSDQWGGSFENRQRFALEIVRRVRERVGPNFLILFRISALDLVDGGMTGAESAALARAIEAAGADMFTTGIGWHEARIPTIAQAVPPAGFVWAESNIKNAVTIPVAASNRINTPELGERIVAEGKADIVMMARPFLADENFVAKAQAGDRKGINVCIACNQACLDHYFERRACSCLVNPRACHETVLEITPAKQKRRVAVVGGGPGGLSCAAAAAECGHDVTLYEAEGQLGGQFNLAKAIPGKEVFSETISYFANRLDRLGATVKLNEPATTDVLSNANFDAVVIAAGVTPRTPQIPGINHKSVASYVDILTGQCDVGERVVIMGAGGIGFDVAVYLLERKHRSHLDPKNFADQWGIDLSLAAEGGLRPHGNVVSSPPHKITMLKRSAGRFGATLGKTTGWVHKSIMDINKVDCIGGVTYEKIDDAGVHILDTDGERHCIPADTIILCTGQERNNSLEAELASSGLVAHTIGGAREAVELDAKRAIQEGIETALRLG